MGRRPTRSHLEEDGRDVPGAIAGFAENCPPMIPLVLSGYQPWTPRRPNLSVKVRTWRPETMAPAVTPCPAHVTSKGHTLLAG